MAIPTDVEGREFRKVLNEALAALASNDAAAVPGGPYPFAFDTHGPTGLRIKRGDDEFIDLWTGPVDPISYEAHSVVAAVINRAPISTASQVTFTPQVSPAELAVAYTAPAPDATPLPDQPVVDQTLVFAASDTSKSFTTPIANRALGVWSVTVDGYQVMTTGFNDLVVVNTSVGRHLVTTNGITRFDSAARSIKVVIRRLSL